MLQKPFYLLRLEQELIKRKDKNPRYSQRGLAAAFKLSPSFFSRILKAERFPSLDEAKSMCSILKLTPNERRLFLESVARAQFKLAQEEYEIQKREISEEQFQSIAQWQAAAILELITTESCEHTPHYIAKRLKIDLEKTKTILRHLMQSGLLKKNELGKYTREKVHLTTKDKEKTSFVHRERERQIREKAAESLMRDPIEVRSMTSLTLAIDPNKFMIAKKMIQDFQNQLWEVMEQSAKKEVYQLCVSFFPLTEMESLSSKKSKTQSS